MNKDQAKDLIKTKLEDYLVMKGINPRKKFLCLNPRHNDTHPSMSLDRRHNRVKCFSCGAAYDVFDLIGMDYGLTDNRDIFLKAYELFDIHPDGMPEEGAYRRNDQKQQTEQPEPDYTAYFEACKKRITETDYHRGLSLETLKRFNVGYDPAWRHPKVVADGKNPPASPRLIVPTSSSSYLARDTRAELTASQKEYRKSKVGRVHIFNLEALESDRPCFVVEGEIDALSIIDVGGSALALGSASNVGLFLKALDEKRPKAPLIISLDNDPAGMSAANDLAEGLKKRNIPFYRQNPCEGFKDANEALQKDRDSLRTAVAEAETGTNPEEEERQAYLETNTGAYISQFIDGIAESVNTAAIPTGFKRLDDTLDGGLYEGLITIGGISSLGKTTLVMQIADQVASAGYDVLIFSLEMSRTELMSKSISRHTLQIATRSGMDTHNAKTARGITDGRRYVNYSRAENDLIQAAIKAYEAYAGRLYIQEGMGNIGVREIRETVEKHIHFTGRRPLVIIDYLQILAPYNERSTDKQNTDKAILELKRTSRDFKLPVIAISSFNRGGYTKEASFEQLKESGAIEYSSDIVLTLQLKGVGNDGFKDTTAKQKDPREIECIVLKNRQGRVGDELSFAYYPMFNLFVE